MAKNILEMRKINKSFPGVQALKDVTFVEEEKSTAL